MSGQPLSSNFNASPLEKSQSIKDLKESANKGSAIDVAAPLTSRKNSVANSAEIVIEEGEPAQARNTSSSFSLNSIRTAISDAFSSLTSSSRESSPATRARLSGFIANNLYGVQEERRGISSESISLFGEGFPNTVRTRLETGIANGTIENVSIRNSTGNNLMGHFHRADPEKNTGKIVLFLGGSAGNVEGYAHHFSEKYQSEGVSTLAVNYRGFGESVGVPSENGLYKDAKAMYDFLVNEKNIPPENIIIHGFSMGGPVAAELVKRVQKEDKPVGGLFLDRPMASLSKAAEAKYDGGEKMKALAGQIGKVSAGSFSIEKKFDNIALNTKVLLITDRETLGPKGEELRTRLTNRSFNISGEASDCGHLETTRLIKAPGLQGSQWNNIKNFLDIP